MNQQEILNIHRKISVLLNNKQLKDSFNTLDLLLHSLQIWSFTEDKIELENTYKLMLQYAVDGVQDPERNVIYNKLTTSIYALSDKAKESLLLRDSNNYEYQQMRLYQASSTRTTQQLFSDILDSQLNLSLVGLVDSDSSKRNEFQKVHENLQIELFNKVWLTQHYLKDEIDLMKNLMKNQEIDVQDKCLLISALTLNLLRNFDEEKILLLFDFYTQAQALIKQRAIVGIMLAMYLYNGRLHFYPSIRNRLVLESDDIHFCKNVQFVIIQFIRSKETENISRKLRDEILPEMIKISPLLENKIDLEGVNKIEDFEEKNPEWQEVLEKTGIGDKLKELSELQVEGADVFMSTFASLKHFPFFNTISNWFLSFDINHSSIQGIVDPKEKTFLHTLLKSGFMCNSDKYSFCLSLSQISESQRNLMMSSFGMESEEMENEKKQTLNPTLEEETLSNQYLQDLYRFYKLFFYKNHFTDIFALPLDFHNTWFYKNIGFENHDLREIAEYCFLKNRYEEALHIFQQLLETERDNVELLQKSGYCYQHLGKIAEALEYYLQAETISTNDKWTIRKIAFCYRVLKRYEKAYEYYNRAELLIPDNLNIQLNVGHCLLQMKKYKEALNAYFKIEFTSPDNSKVWRAIAWCSFLSKKFSQAQKYYAKLLEIKLDHNDLMNAGHVEWGLGNRLLALEFYKKSIEQNNGNLSEFLKTFKNDIPDLIASGIKEEEIPIMTDRLKYMI